MRLESRKEKWHDSMCAVGVWGRWEAGCAQWSVWGGGKDCCTAEALEGVTKEVNSVRFLNGTRG